MRTKLGSSKNALNDKELSSKQRQYLLLLEKKDTLNKKIISQLLKKIDLQPLLDKGYIKSINNSGINADLNISSPRISLDDLPSLNKDKT